MISSSKQKSQYGCLGCALPLLLKLAARARLTCLKAAQAGPRPPPSSLMNLRAHCTWRLGGERTGRGSYTCARGGQMKIAHPLPSACLANELKNAVSCLCLRISASADAARQRLYSLSSALCPLWLDPCALRSSALLRGLWCRHAHSRRSQGSLLRAALTSVR